MDQDQEQHVKELRLIVGMIRGLSDTFDTEAFTRRVTDGPEDQVDAAVQGGSNSYVVMIRKAADVLLSLLNTSTGMAAVGFIGQHYEDIFSIVKRFSELLGPVVMLCSIAARLCYYDFQMLSREFKIYQKEFNVVDQQVQDLKKSLNTIKGLVDTVTGLMEPVTEYVQRLVKDSDHSKKVDEHFDANQLNELFIQIECETNVADIHVRSAERLLEGVKTRMSKYRSTLLLRNSVVAVGYAGVLYGLFRKSYIDHYTAVVGLFAGALPFCYSYFSLSVDIQDLLIDIKGKEMNNFTLKIELEKFKYRMDAMKKIRENQVDHHQTR